MLDDLISRYPTLAPLRTKLTDCMEVLKDAFTGQKKLLVCGNGGSAADSDHIAGELLKGFLHQRPLSESDGEVFSQLFPTDAQLLKKNCSTGYRSSL